MNRYGQSITWGPLTAPSLFNGEVISYSLRDAQTEQDIDGASTDYIAMALHSRKGEVNYEATVTGGTGGTSNFLDLSTGAAVVVSTISGGVVLASEAVEKWQLGQPKTASVRATWYPDITQASPVLAGTTLDARTPDQSGLGIIAPGGKIIYGTYGITHAAGIVHSLTLTQQIKITEDDPDPSGTIKGAATSAYMRKISMEILATGAIPAVASTLVLTGLNTNVANYLITSATQTLARGKGKMYAIEASWIPPFGS